MAFVGVQGNLRFRVATKEDAAQIAALMQAAFRAEDTRDNWTGDLVLAEKFNVTPEDVLRRINEPNGVTLMAIDADDTFVGCIQVRKKTETASRLSMLAVNHHHHRSGIGRKVIAQAEEYSRTTWGINKFELNALSTRPELIAWYERCGFRKTGVTTPFPKDLLKDTVLPDDMFFYEFEKDGEASDGPSIPNGEKNI